MPTAHEMTDLPDSATTAMSARRRTDPIGPVAKVALLARVWRTYIEVQLALGRSTLPAAVQRLAVPTTSDPLSVSLLSRAVTRGLRVGPWRPRCLQRSLVLFRLLRAQGDAAELVIGLAERPTSHDAHAWVEMAGRDVGPWPGRNGHQDLVRYPR
jgi:hypothetical protein